MSLPPVTRQALLPMGEALAGLESDAIPVGVPVAVLRCPPPVTNAEANQAVTAPRSGPRTCPSMIFALVTALSRIFVSSMVLLAS